MSDVVARVISGGQTGADRGALDAAIALGIEHGGHCPKGRKSEWGFIPFDYNLTETESPEYVPRTILNVQNADATLVLSQGGVFDRGTARTLDIVKEMGKPFCQINLRPGDATQVTNLRGWLFELSSRLGRRIVINVAGPRESRSPHLQGRVTEFLKEVLK